MQHKYLNKTTKGNLKKKKEGIPLLDLDKTQNKLTNSFETKIKFQKSAVIQLHDSVTRVFFAQICWLTAHH